jgi:hypothetical protein
VSVMPRKAVTRYPANYRPPPTDDVAHGVPALQLVAMLRAESAFNAVAIAEAWQFEPPTSTPVPYAEIPREVAFARIGEWSRHLDSKPQAAKRALRIKSEAPASVAGELNGSPTCRDSSPEIASLKKRAKSTPQRMPHPNPWGKRHIVRPEAQSAP